MPNNILILKDLSAFLFCDFVLVLKTIFIRETILSLPSINSFKYSLVKLSKYSSLLIKNSSAYKLNSFLCSLENHLSENQLHALTDFFLLLLLHYYCEHDIQKSDTFHKLLYLLQLRMSL